MNDSPTASTANPAGAITITHTNEDGTLVDGTTRGDGSRDALHAARFRWSRNLGMWFMPQSRGYGPRRDRIDLLAAGLRAAGFTVTVDIAEYDPAASFHARQEAGRQRGDRLDARAQQQRGLGEASGQAAHDAVAGIPTGQPVAAGRAGNWQRAAIGRSQGSMGVANEHHQNAQSAAERADAARRQAARRESPVVMGRKVERLETEERDLNRKLATATGDYADRLKGRLQVVQSDLTFLRKAIKETGVRVFTKADFKPGDHALIRGTWRRVKKANAKTLAVETAYSWTDNYPYHEVTDRREAPEQAAA
jgi:hypothetical protein